MKAMNDKVQRYRPFVSYDGNPDIMQANDGECVLYSAYTLLQSSHDALRVRCEAAEKKVRVASELIPMRYMPIFATSCAGIDAAIKEAS